MNAPILPAQVEFHPDGTPFSPLYDDIYHSADGALAQALTQPGDAQRLHDALASMSEAVLAYRGLASVRPALLRWLAEYAAQPA